MTQIAGYILYDILRVSPRALVLCGDFQWKNYQTNKNS